MCFMPFSPTYMPNLSSYFGVLTTRLTSIPHTVPCYVISILATYPACRNLLHLTVLTISVDLNKTGSFCLCNTNLATYPAQCNLLHFTKFRSILIMPSQFVGLLNVFLLQVSGLTFYMDLSFSPCYFLIFAYGVHDLGVREVCLDFFTVSPCILIH